MEVDVDEESFLILERNSKDRLEQIKARVTRKDWGVFRSKLSRNPAIALKGFARWKYQRKLNWYKFKIYYQDFISQAELWQGSFKKIEGYFGSGVLAYFRFLKWLLQMNILIMLLWVVFVVIPQGAMVAEPLEDLAARNMANPIRVHTANVCSSQYDIGYNATSFLDYIVSTLEGTGWMKESLVFYGVYSETYLTSDTGSLYNLPLAYICITLTYLLTSLFLMCIHTGDTLKYQILTGWKMKTFRAYSNVVFAGWDYSLTNEDASVSRHLNLHYEICSSLEEDRDEDRRRNRTVLARVELYSRRLVINIFVLAVLGVSGFLIFYTQNQMASMELEPDFADKGLITQLLIKYIPPITITLLNGGIPVVFTQVVQLEDYSPDHQIQLTLLRTVFLRLASLAVLTATLYRQVTCEPVDFCGVGLAPHCPRLECWETYVGEQFYKLVLMNLIVNVVVCFCVEVPRRLIVKGFPKYRIIQIVGLPQFQIPKNVLDLVFLQCLAWIGSFFAPLLPVIIVVQMVLIFYIKRFTTMNNYIPSKRPYRASMANVFFMIVLMTAFVLCCIPIGYVVWVLSPSTTCGPFRVYAQQYTVIRKAIATWPEPLQTILTIIQTPGVLLLAFLVLCIILYFYHATSNTKQELIDMLREQITEESRDKQFLLMRLNEVTGEAQVAQASATKGNLSRLAKHQNVSATTQGADAAKSYDSMGDTKPDDTKQE